VCILFWTQKLIRNECRCGQGYASYAINTISLVNEMGQTGNPSFKTFVVLMSVESNIRVLVFYFNTVLRFWLVYHEPVTVLHSVFCGAY
jgi:hypothetical protein